MNVVDHISKTYFSGKISEFAAWLGEDQRLIMNWRRRQRIPTKRMEDILILSDETEKGISPADFFPQRLNVMTSPAAGHNLEAAE